MNATPQELSLDMMITSFLFSCENYLTRRVFFFLVLVGEMLALLGIVVTRLQLQYCTGSVGYLYGVNVHCQLRILVHHQNRILLFLKANYDFLS